MASDALVRDYLGRLEAAAWPLAADRRSELLGEVREHIETAMGEAGRGDEVTVRNILERLGAPEEIAAAEVASLGAGTPADRGAERGVPGTQRQPVGAVEILALLLLTLGAIFLPIVGPLMGLVFLWLSERWTRREKWVATAIVIVLVLVPILGVMAAGSGAGATSSTPLPAFVP